MKYLDLKENLRDFVSFSVSDILKIDAKFYAQRLSEWQRKGYIKKITKGYYTFSDTKINESVLSIIANRLYSPSYISLEMALSFYGIIPESVYTITSITSRRTRNIKTEIGQFSYTSVRPDLFFGYRLEPHKQHNFMIAEPEKAILDFFYNNPGIDNQNSFYELRINKDSFSEKVDVKKLNGYLKLYKNQALEQRIKKFIEFITHA
ncbi:MAG: hypothetical protein UX08_C0001G0069 [Candidatus Collierbacteria bacterium GW2011_GWB1_45_35]|uniref:Transcriptional regulator, AbiEi antitoxin, Type IV TA system n=2 Tax=Candidatus Collieribacteriota TaxID=1752725 RepID=A0A0G1NKR0_9BACT|nr:MAG: hypothetical protein UW48_C0003G0066 [Microgenomates group bacterium GW2011_GWC1_44_23]KKT84784.1 MAG: hypothetical protein UW84_C0049G0007 [Candidatus Collierbacteria bacterium GW2011_GWA2_44_99]KKT95931.1 MAG: hypothetical protein UW96_C0003G0066 [Candidatus Collierbacteria bacterium GW2011_GWA1_45_15]KKU00965.1 MAG: hypothetical protein UX01_C0003G0018 [Candidatus Collierbacteria bacterium GW2011_GWB2_45_17]KKU05942.1 MAG: hypothetical protein UX08_C0001G0069 [Candidatus Collierbacte